MEPKKTTVKSTGASSDLFLYGWCITYLHILCLEILFQIFGFQLENSAKECNLQLHRAEGGLLHCGKRAYKLLHTLLKNEYLLICIMFSQTMPVKFQNK
jgi:hypothetical protein